MTLGDRLRGLALMIVGISTVAGCSQPATVGPESAAGPEGASRVASRPSLDPSDALGFEDRKLLFLAQQSLLSRCMTSAGFRYEVIPPSDDQFHDRARPYGNDDIEAAREHGYGILEARRKAKTSGTQGDGNAAQNANERYVQSLSAEQRQGYQRAMRGGPGARAGQVRLPNGVQIGFPLDGCVAQATNELYGDGGRFMMAQAVVENMDGDVEGRVSQDSRFTEALDRWRRCLSARGTQVARPEDASDAAGVGYETLPEAEARRREVDIAVADAECNIESRLAATGRDLESRYWPAVLKDQEGPVEAYREMRDQAAKRAGRVLAG